MYRKKYGLHGLIDPESLWIRKKSGMWLNSFLQTIRLGFWIRSKFITNSNSPVLLKPLYDVAKKLNTILVFVVKNLTLTKSKRLRGGFGHLYICFKQFKNQVKFYTQMKSLFRLEKRNANKNIFETKKNVFIPIVSNSRYIKNILPRFIFFLEQLDIIIKINWSISTELVYITHLHKRTILLKYLSPIFKAFWVLLELY